MRIYLLFIIVLIGSCQTKQVNKATKSDCEKFKTGKFLHESEGDPVMYKIERNDSIQREIIGKSGGFANFKITWRGPCSYELTFLNQHIITPDSITESGKNLKVKVEIIKVRNDTCFVLADNGTISLPGIVYIDKK